MVVMDEETSLDSTLLCLFGLICQLFGYSHNTVALALLPWPCGQSFGSFGLVLYQVRSSRVQLSSAPGYTLHPRHPLLREHLAMLGFRSCHSTSPLRLWKMPWHTPVPRSERLGPSGRTDCWAQLSQLEHVANVVNAV